MVLYGRGNARQSLLDTVLFRALSQVATILGYIVMVRAMAMEDFGVFNLLYAFIPVVSTVASLGLEQTLRRYQPEYLKAGNAAASSWLVRFVASARFGTNVLLLALILLAWNQLAPIVKLAPYRAEFMLFSVLILLHFQSRILQLSLASHMLHRFSVGSMAVLAFAKLAGYGLLALMHAFSLENAIIVDTVGYAVSYLVMRVQHRKHCLPDEALPGFRPEPEERKRMIRYGVFNNFNDAGTLLLNSKSDNFFIAAVIDPVSVGIYSFYTRLNEMVGNLLPTRLFENVVQPVFFGMKPGDAPTRTPQYFTFLLNMNLLLQWPVLAFSIAYHAELVEVVFGGKYGEHSWMLPLIVGFAALNVIAVPVTLVAQYEEKAGIILLSKVTAVYNVAALLLLLPVVGIYGAALASGSAQLIKNAFVWWHVRDRAVWIDFWPAVGSGLGLWGAAVGVCYLLKPALGGMALLNLAAGLLVCGMVTLLYVRSPALSAFDRQLLRSLLAGRGARILRVVGL